MKGHELIMNHKVININVKIQIKCVANSLKIF